MILIINRSKGDASLLSEMLHYMGVLSYGIAPDEALSEIKSGYRAAIVMEPERISDADILTAELSSYGAIPIFAITDSNDVINRIIFCKCFGTGTYAAEILKHIRNYAAKSGRSAPGDYSLGALNASAMLPAPTYLSSALPLTKTEAMILRYLIIRHPAACSAEEILKYSFRQTRVPELSNIRTHISVMNRKFRSIINYAIVEMNPKDGYSLKIPD